jgi:hypothetical protein
MLRVNTERRFYPDLKIGVWRRRTYRRESPIFFDGRASRYFRRKWEGGIFSTFLKVFVKRLWSKKPISIAAREIMTMSSMTRVGAQTAG